jgi:hypothetical protein
LETPGDSVGLYRKARKFSKRIPKFEMGDHRKHKWPLPVKDDPMVARSHKLDQKTFEGWQFRSKVVFSTVLLTGHLDIPGTEAAIFSFDESGVSMLASR